MIHEKPYDLGGYSWEFLVGVCCPVLQILTLFQTKKCHFPHPSQTRPLKSILVFLLAFRQKLCHNVTQIRAQTNKVFKRISNSHFSISFLFIWNPGNHKYVHTLP